MEEIYNPELEKYARKENPLLPLEDVSLLVKERNRLRREAKKDFSLEDYEALYEAPPELVSPRFDNMVERLARETRLVGELEDTISKDNLLRNKDERIFPVEVTFGKEEELNLTEEEKEKKTVIHGDFDPKELKIRIAEPEPSKKNLWFELTYHGIPPVLKTLDHELTHYWYERGKRQRSERNVLKAKIEGFLENLKLGFYARTFKEAAKMSKSWRRIVSKRPTLERLPDIPLKFALTSGRLYKKALKEKGEEEVPSNIIDETVAQKAERVFEKKANRTLALIETLTKAYGYESPEDVDLIVVTSQVVDRLKALDFSDKEIATKLAQAKYERKAVSFPELEKGIEALARSRGVTVEDLDTQADVRRLKYETENYKAQIIAQEELKKLVEAKEKEIMTI